MALAELGKATDKWTNAKALCRGIGWGAGALLIPFLAQMPSLAGAQDNAPNPSMVNEVFFGVLRHDVPDLVSGTGLERGLDFNLEAVFSPSVDLFGGQLRPAVGGSVNDSGGTSQIYGYGRWQYDFSSGTFVATGLGGAFNNGDTEPVAVNRKALGSHFLFHIPLEIGFTFDGKNSISIYFDHMSNGYLARPNEGLDDLGIRYGFHF